VLRLRREVRLLRRHRVQRCLLLAEERRERDRSQPEPGGMEKMTTGDLAQPLVRHTYSLVTLSSRLISTVAIIVHAAASGASAGASRPLKTAFAAAGSFRKCSSSRFSA